MHTTLTPSCWHDLTLASLKKPRSDPYNLGTLPKVCLWRSSETTTCCSSTGLPSNTSYCEIKPRALSARKTLWPNSIGVCTLPRFNEIGMGLENRIDLLGSRNLLAIEHTAARLIDHTSPEVTKVLDLLAYLRDSQIGNHILAARFAGLPERPSCTFDDLLGNADELSVGCRLMVLALPWSHPLDLLHPTPRRSRPIAKPLDTPAFQHCGEVIDQARDDANDIPQQRVVGRMMDVGLHHCCIDTQLLAVLQSEVDGRLHHQFIDRPKRLGRQPIEAAVERVMSRHRHTIEVRELAQCVSIGNPLAQFAIVPILDAHQNQRAQDLLWRQSMAASIGILQTLPKIVTNRCDHLFVVVKKVRDRLQQRFKNKPLLYQLKVGKTDLQMSRP